jgi:subtilisin family serine protease
MNRRILTATAVVAVLLTGLLPGAVFARQPGTAARPLPDAIKSMKLDKTVKRPDLKSRVHRDLVSATGDQRVLVRLQAPAASTLASLGRAAEVAQVGKINAQQKAFIAAVKRLDRTAKVLGQTQRATNIVALQVDASQLEALAKAPNVVSVHPVVNYHKALSETVPYIGATKVQAKGYTGQGVRVGILDSGIDYTHVEFGGAGTAGAYEAAYGTSPGDTRNTTLDGLFPTARVKGGFDFVGESWPGDDGIEDPDPDPIDFEGHGTHVADIVGGTHGVAPKVSLYALKVCSAVDTACSGVGLIRAMDWAVDPNGDGSSSDHLDIVNLSLGSDYGEAFDDDLSLAVDTASKLGMLTVAAAGNGGNAPYIAGTPANAKTALAVAQTQVPSATAFPLVVSAPDSIEGVYPNTEVLDWSGFTTGFAGDITYVGQGCPADSIEPGSPEDPYLADPTGKVALIDRGACSVSLKVERAAQAGATAVIIGLVAPGDAYPFAYGGGTEFVPAISIQQDLSEAIKEALLTDTVTVSIGADTIPLVRSMASTSSRGPSSPYNTIKPEIGAPGASVSAVAGSGTGMESFGGTSGATPMITGSAALLRDAFPTRSIGVLKAMLVNNGETKTYNDLKTDPGYLAPITRIGGGEVRVDRSLGATAAAWDASSRLALLSFELRDVTAKTLTLTKTVEVHNYSSKTRTYKLTSTFRYADDKALGAVKISMPSSVTVKSHKTKSFKVTMTITGSKLLPWFLDSGPNALNAEALDLQEFDGYIWLNDTSTTSDNAKKLHLPWHVLPRQSASIAATPSPLAIDTTVPDGTIYEGLPAGVLTLKNSGIGVGAVDTYSMVGTSPDLPNARRGTNTPIIDLKSVGVQTFPVPGDVCSADESFIYVIAINTWERHSTIGAVPGEYDVFLDTDQDGTPDFVVFTATAGPDDISQLTYSFDLNDPDAVPQALFYADNGTNDSNTLLAVCGEQIGMNATNFYDPMDMAVGAYDNYFTTNLTDTIEGITVSPLGERYLGIFDEAGSVQGDVPANGSAAVTVVDFGTVDTNPSETGLLLINNAFRPGDYHGGAPVGREATRVPVTP